MLVSKNGVMATPLQSSLVPVSHDRTVIDLLPCGQPLATTAHARMSGEILDLAPPLYPFPSDTRVVLQVVSQKRVHRIAFFERPDTRPLYRLLVHRDRQVRHARSLSCHTVSV